LNTDSNHKFSGHGNGKFLPEEFLALGENVIFEDGVLVFHPEHIEIGNNVYIGHNTILKGYYKNRMTIGANTWIGQACFFHSAGGLTIANNVGIAPCVKIITSVHSEIPISEPVLKNELIMGAVSIESGCDIGLGAILLPGVRIGEGAIVGAGSVVTGNVDPGTVVAGSPARLLRQRGHKK
jgi:acetyltransferase-like isoleucine patch superfamily enzyme